MTAADIALRDLADEDALLRERVTHLEELLEIYREMAQQGIHAMSRLIAERDAARRQLQLLRGEFSGLRAQRTELDTVVRVSSCVTPAEDASCL
ncbi:MAG: hypothetical protein AB7Q29_11590 [Vicinamibacterales bacterium]